MPKVGMKSVKLCPMFDPEPKLFCWVLLYTEISSSNLDFIHIFILKLTNFNSTNFFRKFYTVVFLWRGRVADIYHLSVVSWRSPKSATLQTRIVATLVPSHRIRDFEIDDYIYIRNRFPDFNHRIPDFNIMIND